MANWNRMQIKHGRYAIEIRNSLRRDDPEREHTISHAEVAAWARELRVAEAEAVEAARERRAAEAARERQAAALRVAALWVAALRPTLRHVG